MRALGVFLAAGLLAFASAGRAQSAPLPAPLPSIDRICQANAAHYPSIVKDGRPLSPFEVCRLAWQTREIR
ncbi:MAG: hypothetical protein ACYCWW_05400 [Deltaproteobacteria bacterium]